MRFTMRQIWDAVDDDTWQKTRISMKGRTTKEKLEICKEYYEKYNAEQTDSQEVDIRIDNYLKALCRGGQLFAGSGLEKALERNWRLDIRKG